MALTRWDPSAPLTPFNLVLVQQSVLPFIEAMADPTSLVADPPAENPLTPQVVKRVSDRLSWARLVCENDWPPRGAAPSSPHTPPCPGAVSVCSWSDWVLRFRGPLLLLPSSLAFIALTLRAKTQR
jgi:hypothetical protein